MNEWISEVGGVIVRIDFDLQHGSALLSVKKHGSEEYFYNAEISLKELNPAMLVWDEVGQRLTVVPLRSPVIKEVAA